MRATAVNIELLSPAFAGSRLSSALSPGLRPGLLSVAASQARRRTQSQKQPSQVSILTFRIGKSMLRALEETFPYSRSTRVGPTHECT